MNKITFVTCYFKIYDDSYDNRNESYYLSKFEEIVNTGLRICVYTHNREIFKDYYDNPNISIYEKDITKSWVYETVQQERLNGDINLPSSRSFEKDTADFMICMNSKVEFLKETIDKNPYNTTHFAWIDFGITYVFKNLASCQELLKFYNSLDFLEPNFLCIPGCLAKTPFGEIDKFVNHVNWRFCGGFFIGDKNSIVEFHSLHRAFFLIFLKKYRTLVWEVNFWAWLEAVVSVWNPCWYLANHNDSIIEFPAKYYCVSLKSISSNNDCSYETIKYDYPYIHNFFPSSASHFSVINKNGEQKHFLNTRYVNYKIDIENGGHYYFNDIGDKIITRNIFSLLDNETMKPICYWDVKEDDTGIKENNDRRILGLEDIRLFQSKNQSNNIDENGITILEFIATSLSYSNEHNNRMVTGKYVIDETCGSVSLNDCRVLPSPSNDTFVCEKNWIPINDGRTFIYKWSPLEIISLNNETDNLNYTSTTIPVSLPLSRRFRCSTIFVDLTENRSLGIVHFTEGDEKNKCYFHCFVEFDKTLMKPSRCSQPFYFENKGIEYCIGFYIKDNKYHYWISQIDRDPLLIITDVPKLKWNNI